MISFLMSSLKWDCREVFFELPNMMITWYCVVQSHMYTKYNIRIGHLEVVMSQQEKR